jgi:hypothetical protein
MFGDVVASLSPRRNCETHDVKLEHVDVEGGEAEKWKAEQSVVGK